ncbi:MAG: integral rane sensor signal transduction histidine kinase [Paenibacillaceae bacterium]|jgi:two-component system sensor histidine kinase YesM|nr:integral rane sensor signal transduction histidine kinase [Paenibacillaceae bacterium]
MNKTKYGIWHSIKSYKMNSLFIRSFIIVLLLVITPLSIIFGIVYDTSKNNVQKEITDLNEATVERARDSLDELFRETALMASFLSLKPEAEAFLLTGTNDPFALDTVLSEMSSSIKFFTGIYRYIHSIYLYSDRNGYLISNLYNGGLNFFADQGWLDPYTAIADEQPLIYARVRETGYPALITVIKPVYFYKGEKIGAVVINLDVEELGGTLGHWNNSFPQAAYIIDKEGKIIFSKDLTLINRQVGDYPLLSGINGKQEKSSQIVKMDEGSYVVSVSPSSINEWTYAAVFPLSYYSGHLEKMRISMIRLFIIVLAAGLSVPFFISIHSFRPVKNVLSVLENPVDIHGDSSSRRIKGDELAFINASIWSARKNKTMMEEELALKLEALNKARASSLLAQINPHFLCNTLDTIKWSAYELTGGKNETSEMIAVLSQLLNLSLDMGNHLVTIAEEVKHGQLYLRIMEMRYPGLFEVKWNMDSSMMQCKITKLSLQPILENAIYHGLKPRKQGGIISITGRIEHNMVHIQIEDNGVGISPKSLAEITEHIDAELVLNGDSIGLRNINQRIKLIFGNEYGISLRQETEGGTAVELVVPRIEAYDS